MFDVFNYSDKLLVPDKGALLYNSLMPATLTVPFVFSQSSLQDYTDCPRRFDLRYIERLSWPAIETEPTLENERRQQAGQFFHRMVQQALIGLPIDKLGKLANSPELSRWWQNFCEAYPGIVDGKTLYPEISLSAPLGPHRLTAKYDLVAVSNNKAIIYDWKTYHKRPRNEFLATRWQTHVYRYLLVEAGKHLNNGQPFMPEQLEMVYWFADFPAEPASFAYSANQHRSDKGALEKIITEIGNIDQFSLTDEKTTCRFCTYRSYCERGITAGDWHEAETENEIIPEIIFEQISEIEI